MEEFELISKLIEVNKELTEHIVELSKEFAKMQMVTNVPMEQSSTPLNTPETEEDAQYLLQNGLIDTTEYEAILKELQFYNAEIAVPTQH